MRLATLQFETRLKKSIGMGIRNPIQNFLLGRYIVVYTVGNHVLRLCSRVAVKLNFRPYIGRFTAERKVLYTNPLIECCMKHIFGVIGSQNKI